MIAATTYPATRFRRLLPRRCASRHRTPRSWYSRPAHRRAGQKLVPGFFRSAPRARTWSRRSQVADSHPGNRLCGYEIASGCTVAANRGGLWGGGSFKDHFTYGFSGGYSGFGSDAESAKKLPWSAGAKLDPIFPHPLQEKLVQQYIWGEGESVHLSEAEMSELGVNVDLRRSPAFRGRVGQKVRFTMLGGAHLNGTLGHFTVEVEGRLERDPNTGELYFVGRMRFKDRYDFDPKAPGVRPRGAEARVRFANRYLPGQAYDIDSDWVEVRQRVGDAEAEWSGAGNEGLARIYNSSATRESPGG